MSDKGVFCHIFVYFCCGTAGNKYSYEIGDTEKLQFTDDDICMLKDIFTVQVQLKSFNELFRCSGFKVTFSKTEALYSLKERNMTKTVPQPIY